jgi:hypothetical protein
MNKTYCLVPKFEDVYTTLWVYIDQPLAGSCTPYWAGNPGHAWCQVNLDVVFASCFPQLFSFANTPVGLYQESDCFQIPLINPCHGELMIPDTQHVEDQQKSFPVKLRQALVALGAIKQTYENSLNNTLFYNTYTYNCIDFVKSIASSAGVQLNISGINCGAAGENLMGRTCLP